MALLLLTCKAELGKETITTKQLELIHSLQNKLTLKKSSWCTTQQLGNVFINLFVRVVLPPLVTLSIESKKYKHYIVFSEFQSCKV